MTNLHETIKDLSLLMGVDITWKEPANSPLQDKAGDMTHQSEFCIKIKSQKIDLKKCVLDCSDHIHYADDENKTIRKVCHAGGQLICERLYSEDVYLGSMLIGPFTYDKKQTKLGQPYFDTKKINKIYTIIAEVTPLLIEKILNQTKQSFPLKRNPKIVQVLTYIEKNYNKNITIQDLSEACHLSNYRLMHLFKQEVKQTIFEYLITLRMKKACELLKTTSLKVNVIAGLVGFESTNFFNLKFKKKIKLTPLVYRRKNYIAPNP